MSSRLFHAIVGVGIAMGGATVACGGGVVPTEAEATSGSAYATDAAAADPTTDAAVASEAGPDAEAFCDVSWPTTKGNVGGPTCGPVQACQVAGPAPFCVPTTPTGACRQQREDEQFVARCVGTSWSCTAGSIPAEGCKCWVGQPCP